MAAFVAAHEGMHPVLPEPVHVRFVEAPPFVVPAPAPAAPPAPTAQPRPAPAKPAPAPPERARRVPLERPRRNPPQAPSQGARAKAEPPLAPAAPVAEQEAAAPAPGIEPDVPAAEPAPATAGERTGAAKGDVAPDPDAPVELPGDATPPRLAPGNAVPDYPPDARAARRTGVVVLRVIVTAEGRVSEVQVVDGSEPFVASAIRAVSGWRYEPARHRGRPIAVYRTVRIPFRLAD